MCPESALMRSLHQRMQIYTWGRNWFGMFCAHVWTAGRFGGHHNVFWKDREQTLAQLALLHQALCQWKHVSFTCPGFRFLCLRYSIACGDESYHTKRIRGFCSFQFEFFCSCMSSSLVLSSSGTFPTTLPLSGPTEIFWNGVWEFKIQAWLAL